MLRISSRAKVMTQFFKQGAAKYEARMAGNQFHKTNNSQGIIDMGTAENKLTFDLLEKKFKEKESHTILEEHTQYFSCQGLESFRQTIAEFFNHYMKPEEPIISNDLLVLNGTTPIVDSIAYVVADEGEGFLIPAPLFGSFVTQLQSRSRVIPFPVELSSKIAPGENQSFELTVKRLESALQKAHQQVLLNWLEQLQTIMKADVCFNVVVVSLQDIKIRGLLLCNPNNPLGVIYPKELLQSCLTFAARHSLHVIVDEVYMLSGFSKGCSVTNVLSLQDIPDKERLHVFWGFSKDLAVSGFRCGVLHTRNKEVYRAFSEGISMFHDVPAPTQVLLTNLIKDLDWLDNTFIPTNHERLRNAYNMTCDALRKVNIPFHPAEGGLFIWVDFRELVPSATFEEEHQLFEHFIANGVFILPGAFFLCSEPGWFRIIFSIDEETLTLGLTRIQEAVNSTRSEIVARG